MENQFDPSSDTIKALTWKEPFASLMLHGKIETRSWHTHYRGWVLICAGLKRCTEGELYNFSSEDQVEKILKTLRDNEIQTYRTLGKAIAVGRLVNCRPMKRTDEEKSFVEYSPNLFCHVYEDVSSIVPFAFIGYQRWKEITPLERKQIILVHDRFKQLSLFDLK